MTQVWRGARDPPRVVRPPRSCAADEAVCRARARCVAEFSRLAPVYGLIFLFKWTQEMAQAHKSSSNCLEDSKLYFAKQVINNACGTQALLNIMMNAKGMELGKVYVARASVHARAGPRACVRACMHICTVTAQRWFLPLHRGHGTTAPACHHAPLAPSRWRACAGAVGVQRVHC